MPFKDYLREKLAEKGMRPAELARRSGVTKQNIGRILNDTRHPVSGGLPKVTVETVEKLAKGLGVPPDEARFAAGYAPNHAKPQNVAEFLEALDRLGVPDLEFGEAYSGLDSFTPDDLEKLLADIKLVVELNMQRKVK